MSGRPSVGHGAERLVPGVGREPGITPGADMLRAGGDSRRARLRAPRLQVVLATSGDRIETNGRCSAAFVKSARPSAQMEAAGPAGALVAELARDAHRRLLTGWGPGGPAPSPSRSGRRGVDRPCSLTGGQSPGVLAGDRWRGIERNRASRGFRLPHREGAGGAASHTHVGARGAFTNTQGVGDPRDVRSRPFLSHIQKTGFHVGTRGGTRIITAPWFQLGVGDPRCLVSERWECVLGP